MEKEKTVLVVEDDIALQEALKLKLKKEGIRVLTANSGEAALAVLRQEMPDLITLDILLPQMNGIEFLRQIRADKSLKDMPVVVVSVSGGTEKMREAFGLNIVDYLVKSAYKIDDLVGKIKGFLNAPS